MSQLHNASELSFGKQLGILLERFDKANERLYAIHKDIAHTNDGSKEHQEALQEWTQACKAIWRLKAAWSDVK